MFKIFISACFVASALGATIPQDSPLINAHIVGGRDTDISEVPYQVAMYLAGIYWCGGSIVSPTHIVTACHCVYGKQFSSLTFRAGSSSNAAGGVVVKAKNIHQHPMYSMKSLDYDVAVVELQTPLNFSKTIKPINLATKEPKPNSNATASGWGITKESGERPKTLQSVVVPVVDRKTCSDVYSRFNAEITQRMMCAGSEGKDACQGDSGGPLASNGELVGIVSFGAGCGRKDIPGVYTNVADPEMTKFIKGIVKT